MSLITYLARVRFADGVLEDGIEAELAHCRISRPLIVTDRPVQGNLVARLLAALPDAVRPSLQDVPAGITLGQAELEAASDQFIRGRCDGILGFGGTVAIELARLLALTRGNRAAEARLMAGPAHPLRHNGALLPVITVPTTPACGAGLGTCVRILGAEGRPITLIGPALRPMATICDPTLICDEGPEAMAAAVMDVLVHCLETYLCSDWNPPADGIALEGLRRASAVLDRALDDRSNLEARRELMAAALNGALAGEKGLGGIHALAHALEDQRGLRHGQMHAALAPQVLEFNAPAVGQRYRMIKEAMRLPARADLPCEFAALGARLSLPATLGHAGFARSCLPPIARNAEADPTNRTNPRLATSDDYQTMLEAAL